MPSVAHSAGFVAEEVFGVHLGQLVVRASSARIQTYTATVATLICWVILFPAYGVFTPVEGHTTY